MPSTLMYNIIVQHFTKVSFSGNKTCSIFFAAELKEMLMLVRPLLWSELSQLLDLLPDKIDR